MVILNVTYHIKQGKRDAFMDAIRALGVQEASLLAHTKAPHFGKLGGLKAEFVQSVSIAKFAASKLQ